MTRKNLIMHYSLFVAMVGIVAGGDAFSAVRIGNATKNQYYANQMAQYQAMNQVASTNDIAAASGNDTARDANSVGESQLAACQQIYPTGEFEIARPTAGLGMGGAKTCTAVVELRGYQMGQNGGDAVLARANIAAGTTIDCNISAFPETSYTLDAQRVVFPADAEPTVEDVVAVMNQEQKQNAGMKIAAAALVGAIGGNISGRNDVGKDGFIGTDKNKMQNTVIGALGGAAIGAGGAYGGYEAGNMIMSAGVNAAAGAAVGNMVASSNEVLSIKQCGNSPCLLGNLISGTPIDKSSHNYYVDLSDRRTVMRCNINNEKCEPEYGLLSIKLGDDDNAKLIKDMTETEIQELVFSGNVYHVEEQTNGSKEMASGQGSQTFALISGAKQEDGMPIPVVIKDLSGFNVKALGNTETEFNRWKKDHQNIPIYKRNVTGDAIGEPIANANMEDFVPMTDSAKDGGIIDLGNKARLKSTLVGAGTGGALGAFTAYEGAQSDIDDRWVSAVREYKDSQQKFYCATGNRFLSYYNDVVIIPSVKE